jgi:hypothetical protein
MAGAENYFKFEVHMVIIFLQAEGASQSKSHHRLVSVYSQNVFSGSVCVVQQI